MKIKLFGIPIIEYQPHEIILTDRFSPPPFQSVSRAPLVPPKPDKRAKRQATADNGEIPNQKSLADLSTDPASSLPVHKVKGKMRLNIDAALDLYGITDPKDLWSRDFNPGSAGKKLRAALGGVGYGPNKNAKCSGAEPAPLTAIQLADLDKPPTSFSAPSSRMPLRAENRSPGEIRRGLEK